MIKWVRDPDGNYVSEDGQLLIHRYWSDARYKTRYRNWWTLCSSEAHGWDVVEDIHRLAAAKKLAERFVAEKNGG
jgi:hypothetical protein